MKMEKKDFPLTLVLAVFLSITTLAVSTRLYGNCRIANGPLSKCAAYEFECFDGSCIERSGYCNRIKNCADGSDERYCENYYSSCPGSPRNFIKCRNTNRCIPPYWKCDGIIDCPQRDDELECGSSYTSKWKSLAWMRNISVPSSPTRKWGPFVHKAAVALFLSDPEFLSHNSSARKEITYELSIQLLSRISRTKIQDIPSSDLASFINAFLVTCTDPRDFHGFNLVDELRSRVEAQNYTMPYVLLTLCNAGDAISVSDVRKLTDAFWTNKREIWTDSQAIALMALSCAKNQSDSSVDDEVISELALELKQRQYRNGTVENLYNTLLVMQALYAAETDSDPDNFDESKALSYIIENQKPDGSFGNFLLTYYALPVLSCKSMVNITASHCKPVEKDEDTAVYDLINHDGPKTRVRYSIWFGMKRDIERTLSLLVPAKTSFYGVMEIAAEIDKKYKFEYIMKNRKPYITALSGIMDDSENEQYWFPCTVKDGKASILEQSTADVIPKNDEHIVMWYREGSWVE